MSCQLSFHVALGHSRMHLARAPASWPGCRQVWCLFFKSKYFGLHLLFVLCKSMILLSKCTMLLIIHNVYIYIWCIYYIISLVLHGPVTHLTYHNSAQLKGVLRIIRDTSNNFANSPMFAAIPSCFLPRKKSSPPDRMRPTWVLMPVWPRLVWKSAWPTWAARSPRWRAWRAAWRRSWDGTSARRRRRSGARHQRRSGVRHNYCGGWSVSTWSCHVFPVRPKVKENVGNGWTGGKSWVILGVKRERIEILQGRFKDEKCGEVNENNLQMYVNVDKKGDCQCFLWG